MCQCIILRKSLVKLTQDFKSAMILGQFIFWTEGLWDVNKLIEEEVAGEEVREHCWLPKKAAQLSDDMMFYVLPAAMRSYLQPLIKNNWLLERRNPDNRQDKILQYRINLRQIQKDLAALGLTLSWTNFPKIFSPERDEPQTQILEKETSEQQSNTPESKDKSPTITKEISRTEIQTSSNENQFNKTAENSPVAKVSSIIPSRKIFKKIVKRVVKDTQHKDLARAVQHQLQNLFAVSFPEKQAVSLIKNAEQYGVDIQEIIDNVYEYHTKVEPVRSIIGSINYAIQHGEWVVDKETTNIQDSYGDLPQSVIEQMERKRLGIELEPINLVSPEEHAANCARLRAKLDALRQQQAVYQGKHCNS